MHKVVDGRRIPASIVAVLSISAVVCGAVVLSNGIKFGTNNMGVNEKDGTVEETLIGFKKTFMGLYIGFAIPTILFGFAGMTCICKPCIRNGVWLAALYGIGIIILLVAMFVIGGVGVKYS
jgi:hypothetical protein